MKSRFIARTFEIAPGVPDVYRGEFSRCIFILKGGDAGFLLCRFEDCTFIPPLMQGDAVAPEWDDLLVGCSIERPQTRLLIKSGEHPSGVRIDTGKRCRSIPGEVCYNPDRCVFDCSREERRTG